MTKMTLRRLALLLLAAAASAVAASPASAQTDWWRRQQQQDQLRRQQQQQQQELDRQRRQQQQQEQRRQQQLQEQQRIRQQMQEQIQRDLRARMQREQQQRQQAQQRPQQQQRNRAVASAGASRLGGRAGVGRASAGTGPSSGSVARLNRPLTAAELRRGFTGKITLDGRALVRVGNRVLAVPASRVGVRVNRVQSPSVATRWNASKRAAVSAEVQRLAATRASRGGGAGGGKPPGGGGNGGTGGKLLWTSWDKYPKVQYKGREYATIGDRLYGVHAVERMQPRGMGYRAGISEKHLRNYPTGKGAEGRGIAPAFVEEVIKTGKREEVIYEGVPRTLFTAGTTTVVTEEGGRIVVSIITR